MHKQRELISSEIINRMKKICNASSDRDLAAILNISPPAIAGWRKRDIVPFEALDKINQEYNVSLDWLVYGREHSVLTPNEKVILMAFNNLSDPEKLKMIGIMMGLSGGGTSNSAAVDQSNNNGGTNNYIAGNYTISNTTTKGK